MRPVRLSEWCAQHVSCAHAPAPISAARYTIYSPIGVRRLRAHQRPRTGWELIDKNACKKPCSQRWFLRLDLSDTHASTAAPTELKVVCMDISAMNCVPSCQPHQQQQAQQQQQEESPLTYACSNASNTSNSNPSYYSPNTGEAMSEHLESAAAVATSQELTRCVLPFE